MIGLDFEEARKRLVEHLKESGAIKSPTVEQAFLSIPRERFFVEDPALSYVDAAFRIGYGQTISQPTTIAIMLELLDVRTGQKVLEVGSGSGYVLALLSKLVGKNGKVFGIELIVELAERSRKTLADLNITNVKIFCRDGKEGLPEHAPFDRILISAGTREVPDALTKQLATNGKLVAPVGGGFYKNIVLLEKDSSGSVNQKHSLGYFSFVPLK